MSILAGGSTNDQVDQGLSSLATLKTKRNRDDRGFYLGTVLRGTELTKRVSLPENELVGDRIDQLGQVAYGANMTRGSSMPETITSW